MQPIKAIIFYMNLVESRRKIGIIKLEKPYCN